MEARISGDTGRQSGALRWRRKSHRTGPRENADGTRCRRRAGRAGAAALLLVPVLAPAQHPAPLDDAAVSRQIVTVRVYKDDRLAAQGAGVVVSGEGDVLTSAAVLDAGPRVAVVAQGSGELGAAERLKEKGSGLGVLRVDGLQRAGLPVSTAPLAPGARIFAVTPGTTPGQAVAFSAGAVGEVAVESIRGGEEARFVQHNAMIAARGYGSPSLDECGRIVALNVPDPGAFTIFTVPRKIQPEGLVFALAAGEIAPRLTELGIAFTRVTEACASAEARAQSQAQEAERAQEEARQAQEESARAQQRAEELQERARQAEAGAAASEQEKREARAAAERARQRSEAARARAEEAGRAVETARQAAEARLREAKARQRTERLRRLMLWGGSACGVLVLAALLFWASSARRKRRAVRLAQARAAEAKREAAEARQRIAEMPRPAPFDCVLTGAAGGGVPHALNLRRDVLGNPAGVIVGRNPTGSSHVVADPSVSREHARLYVAGSVLHVEDLGSTNGTSINGRTLVPGQGERAGAGDELTIGSVTLRIDLKP